MYNVIKYNNVNNDTASRDQGNSCLGATDTRQCQGFVSCLSHIDQIQQQYGFIQNLGGDAGNHMTKLFYIINIICMFCNDN